MLNHTQTHNHCATNLKQNHHKNDSKWFLSKVKQAIRQYNLIEPGDHVAVALSGGKDSLVLLWILHQLQQRSHLQFTLSAVHIQSDWPDQPEADTHFMTKLCSMLSIPLSFEKSFLAQAISPNGILIDNPCSLCSRLRRGALLRWAEKNQCNKIALGHHLDDVVETWFLNLLHGGRFEVFAPRIDYDDRGISIIRPLVYLEEETCVRIADREQMEPMKNPCPVDHHTQRQAIKQLLATMRQQYPDINRKVLHALEHTTADQLWSHTETIT